MTLPDLEGAAAITQLEHSHAAGEDLVYVVTFDHNIIVHQLQATLFCSPPPSILFPNMIEINLYPSHGMEKIVLLKQNAQESFTMKNTFA